MGRRGCFGASAAVIHDEQLPLLVTPGGGGRLLAVGRSTGVNCRSRLPSPGLTCSSRKAPQGSWPGWRSWRWSGRVGVPGRGGLCGRAHRLISKARGPSREAQCDPTKVHTKEFATMALSKSALSELVDALRAGGDLDVIREGLALVLQALIDAEATQHIGAQPYERSEQRSTHRNGSRSRPLSPKPGDVELRIPQLREGSFFPALLEPRRRIDRALLAVVMEAYVHGTSTPKVDDLVKALGVDSGSSKG